MASTSKKKKKEKPLSREEEVWLDSEETMGGSNLGSNVLLRKGYVPVYLNKQAQEDVVREMEERKRNSEKKKNPTGARKQRHKVPKIQPEKRGKPTLLFNDRPPDPQRVALAPVRPNYREDNTDISVLRATNVVGERSIPAALLKRKKMLESPKVVVTAMDPFAPTSSQAARNEPVRPPSGMRPNPEPTPNDDTSGPQFVVQATDMTAKKRARSTTPVERPPGYNSKLQRLERKVAYMERTCSATKIKNAQEYIRRCEGYLPRSSEEAHANPLID